MTNILNIIAFEYNKNGNNTFIEVFEKEIAKCKFINFILIILLIIMIIIAVIYIIKYYKISPMQQNDNKKND